MESYKKLNKQLIEQIQEMRLKEREYNKRIISLWELLVEEQNKRIELKNRLVALLAKNWKGMMEEIDPGVNIAQLFSAEVDDDGSGGRRTSSTRTSSLAATRTSLAHNSFNPLQRRCTLSKSMEQKSPIRRSGCKYSGGFASVLPEDLSISMDLEESDKTIREDEEGEKSSGDTTDDDGVLSCQSLENIVTPPQLGTINEIAEQEEIERSRRYKRRNVQVLKETALDDTNTTDTSVNENISTWSPTEEIQSPEIVVRRGKNKQNRGRNKKNTTVTENISTCSSPDESKSPQIISRRGKKQKENRSSSTDFNSSIEMPRFCNENFPRNLRHTQNNKISEKENTTLLSTSDALSELTMCNFLNAPCSTPHNLRSNSCNANTKIELEGVNLSNRPSRSCKPTNLVDSNLRQKLRNDSVTKLRSRKKK